jgi:hypothetical protein
MKLKLNHDWDETKSNEILETVIKYNSDGKIIYCKSPFEEYWLEYDENGNKIRYKSETRESIIEYNESNQEIHTKISNGYESWHEYDPFENAVYFHDTRGLEYLRKFDDKGRLIYDKCKNSLDIYEYDDVNNVRYSKRIKRAKIEYKVICDETNNSDINEDY